MCTETNITITLINEAFTSFTKRYGIAPHGVLMSSRTVDILVKNNDRNLGWVRDTDAVTFRGLPIYESLQMNDNEVRFVL